MGSKVVRFPESCELGNLTRSKASRDVEEQLERVEITVKEKRDEDSIRIVLISDTHNRHRSLKLPKGDILIHAGDFTNNGKEKEIKDFDAWLSTLDFQHKILVPGNHDTGDRGDKCHCAPGQTPSTLTTFSGGLTEQKQKRR